jgi:hypothetical protein
MVNNIFPELDGWEKIDHMHLTDKNLVSLIRAVQKLVISIANLRSATSSQIGYLQNKVEYLNDSFIKLNENIKKADESSTRLSTALNRLTFCGVIIAGVSIFFTIIQFLFENKIWPF